MGHSGQSGLSLQCLSFDLCTRQKVQELAEDATELRQ